MEHGGLDVVWIKNGHNGLTGWWEGNKESITNFING